MNFTQGKWRYKKGKFNTDELKDFGGGSILNSDGWHIAMIHNDIGMSDEEQEETELANANLIAASPDMYEALKALISANIAYHGNEFIADNTYTPLTNAMKAAGLALAKAEGK